MQNEEAIEKLRLCRSLCQRLAGLEEGGVELSEADHLAFMGFHTVYNSVVEPAPESMASSTQKEGGGEERLEGLASVAGLSRAELAMLVSLLALHSPQAPSTKKSALLRKRRRRGERSIEG